MTETPGYRPLYRQVFGHEWFIQAGLSTEQASQTPYADVFATVDRPAGADHA